MNKTKLLIVDDNRKASESVKNALEEFGDIEVVGIASDGKEAIEHLKLVTPDAMLLDIVMPRHDGIMLLERLAEGDLPRPAVLVLSALSDEAIVSKCLRLGAKYYMVKPFAFKLLHDRILDLVGKRKIALPEQHVSTRSYDERISSIFLAVGIPAHIKGYQYLREAIKITLRNGGMLGRITKELYPAVAANFSTTASKVERAIRHAIEVAWSRGKLVAINSIFGYTIYSGNDKPTNGEFIALIADKLKMESYLGENVK